MGYFIIDTFIENFFKEAIKDFTKLDIDEIESRISKNVYDSVKKAIVNKDLSSFKHILKNNPQIQDDLIEKSIKKSLTELYTYEENVDIYAEVINLLITNTSELIGGFVIEGFLNDNKQITYFHWPEKRSIGVTSIKTSSGKIDLDSKLNPQIYLLNDPSKSVQDYNILIEKSKDKTLPREFWERSFRVSKIGNYEIVEYESMLGLLDDLPSNKLEILVSEELDFASWLKSSIDCVVYQKSTLVNLTDKLNNLK